MYRATDENALEVDFGAFDAATPQLVLPQSMGKGVQFVARFLSSQLREDSASMKPLLDYLIALNHQGEVQTKLNRRERYYNSTLISEG